MTDVIYAIVAHDGEGSWVLPTAYRSQEVAQEKLNALMIGVNKFKDITTEIDARTGAVFQDLLSVHSASDEELDKKLAETDLIIAEVLSRHGVSKEQWYNTEGVDRYSIRIINVE